MKLILQNKSASALLTGIYVFLAAIFFSVNLDAQTSGKLSGRVLDNEGSPLVGANVLIEETTLGAATDFEGYYVIINVRAGTYKVRIGYLGYKSQVSENVRISPDKTTSLDATLSPEVIEGEEVVVVAQKPLVEFNQTSTVSSINKEEIKNLPVQSLNDIVNLQAGVVDGHFRGGRIGEVQYQLDGVTVNNPFTNEPIQEVDRSIIEEVQVISGTFDAKYGQAMSGVVNTVLKSGGDRFSFSAESYLGDYFTTDTERYPHNDSYNPLSIQYYQLSLSGPTGLPQTTFLASGLKSYNEGYFFGERRFVPTDSSDFENAVFIPTGDNELVPMTTSDEWGGQFKLSNSTISSMQFNYQLTYNESERKYYNHGFRLNPDGIPENYSTSLSHGLAVTHTLAPELFYQLNIRQNYFDYESFKYEDLMDPQYLEAGEPKSDANYEDGAIVQGVDLGRYKQNTNSLITKAEVVWQFDRINFLESGIEFQYSDIEFGPPGFFVSTTENGVQILKPVYEFPNMPGLQSYYPKQFAAYLQDRIELADIVIRAGMRFEYYDPDAQIPSDLRNPANSIEGYPQSQLVDTEIKTVLAPRLGINFPMSASSSVYFSYGHFYQMPALGLLYGNADYSILSDLAANSISYGIMGNPDLRPEFTVQYEFGFKQAISNILGLQLSFFYKDINDLLGTEVIETYNSAEYWRFTNVDFGSVYGFTVSLFQQNYNNISSSLNYTLQFAEGNSSDPRETTNRAASGQDPRPKYVPFNWDQRHTLNLTGVYSIPDDFSISAILKFGSGQPYTPVIGSGFDADQDPNSGRKESYFLIDLRGEKYFNLDIVNLSVFLRVFNLLNAHFVNGFVFNNTGSPDYALYPETVRAQLYDPSRFYEPRRIEFGISLRSL
ncbi:MAG TPA: TonB-dependent receptor [Ignavibacteriaceae bacterium]|nr:TonB-dependent receptor [Ignavibacteriaceae bacterium]